MRNTLWSHFHHSVSSVWQMSSPVLTRKYNLAFFWPEWLHVPPHVNQAHVRHTELNINDQYVSAIIEIWLTLFFKDFFLRWQKASLRTDCCCHAQTLCDAAKGNVLKNHDSVPKRKTKCSCKYRQWLSDSTTQPEGDLPVLCIPGLFYLTALYYHLLLFCLLPV